VGDAGGPRLSGSVSPFVMGGMGGKPSPVLDADDVSTRPFYLTVDISNSVFNDRLQLLLPLLLYLYLTPYLPLI
jgi:hypothetical protein